MASDLQLTPSEIVLLEGDRFASHENDYKKFAIMLAITVSLLAVVALLVWQGAWSDVSSVMIAVVFAAFGAGGLFFAYQEWRAGFAGTRNSLLLDGAASVSSMQLASAMIKAALLANERAGAIRLAIDKDNEGHARVRATPTETPVTWHHATLEQRLVLDRTRPVADIVRDWLAVDSPDPCARAVLQGKIMLCVRDAAVSLKGRWFEGERFRVAGGVAIGSEAIAGVQTLFRQCERGRPDLFSLLGEEIFTAVRARTRAQSSSQETGNTEAPDPWLDERIEDRKRLGAVRVVAAASVRAYLVMLAVVSLFAAVVVKQYDHAWLLAGVTTGILTLASIWSAVALHRRPDAAKRWARRTTGWHVRMRRAAARDGQVIEPLETPPMTLAQRVVSSIVPVPLITIAIVWAWRATDPMPMTLLIGIATVLLFLFLRSRAAEAISETVMKSPADAVAGNPASSPSDAADRPVVTVADSVPRRAASACPVRLNIIDLQNTAGLPGPSAATLARLDVVRDRPIVMRRHFRRGVQLAVLLAVAIVAIGWALSAFSRSSVIATAVLAAITILGTIDLGVVWLRSAAFRGIVAVVTNGRVQVTGTVSPIDESTASPRPLLLSIVLGIWVVAAFSLASAAAFASNRLAFIIAWTGVLAFLLWFQRERAAIEQRLACATPQQLLALRVFGSSHLADFLDLTEGWQLIGVRLRLDGPGTTGHRMRDLVNFAVGRIDKSIVEDEGELAAALAEFHEHPDRKLRFPVNSLQCNNAIWKVAVDRLLDRSDAVVMDLADLTTANRGVAFELGRLFARIDLSRVVLLINYSTDRQVLQEIVADAWAAMPDDSPNAGLERPALCVLDMGGPAERQAAESRADWERRRLKGFDRQRIVALLVDASLPSRTHTLTAPVRDPLVVHWSRSPLSSPLRVLRNAAFVIFLIGQLLSIGCFVGAH